RILRLGAVGAAGLRHVRPTAAALAAQRFGALADEIDGVEAAHQVRGDADHDAGLALLGDADKRDDAGADLLLAFVGEAFQVLDVDAGHRARQELDVSDAAHAVSTGTLCAAALASFC